MEIIKGDPVLLECLEKLCTGKNAVQHTQDSFGNAYNWFMLDKSDLILPAAEYMGKAHARLAIIAAYNDPENQKRMQNACYEFVLDGIVYGLTVHVDEDGVPSISRIFPNADWHEREMMELYDMKVKNHPNPRRLFLDEELDKGIINEVVPLSIMMNGASSSDLWEIIMSGKEGSNNG